MIFRTDDGGQTVYMVTNNQGLCLIRTTNSAIAYYVNAFTKNINPMLRLNIQGDPGTRTRPAKIFHHVKRWR